MSNLNDFKKTWKGSSVRFRVGVILVALNFVLGWPVNAIMAALAAAIGKVWPLYIASATYVFSWVLLGAGVLLGGPDAVRYVRLRSRKLLKRRKSQK